MTAIIGLLLAMLLWDLGLAICREYCNAVQRENGRLAQDFHSLKEKIGNLELQLAEIMGTGEDGKPLGAEGHEAPVPSPATESETQQAPSTEVKTEASQGQKQTGRRIPHRDYLATNGDRSHYLEEIEYAYEIVSKPAREMTDKEQLIAGFIFTDLEDTSFFEQLMAQNADLRDSIESSMRRFMAVNRQQEPCARYYVPESIYQKYMTTNEY